MGTDNILEFGGREAISDPLTELTITPLPVLTKPMS